MGRVGPTEIIIVAVLLIVIFGWKKLPDAARSLGRSARVFKSEVDALRKDDVSTSQTARPESQSAPVEPMSAIDLAVDSTDGEASRGMPDHMDNPSVPPSDTRLAHTP